MPTADIHGVPIAFSDTGVPAGRPDAHTIVFGHGLLFGGWMFEPQIEALRHEFRCVTLDWRGQGDTPATSGGYDMDTLTADAAGLITALSLAPVHWVGLSMGGFIGQRLAARNPELLRSLTLLDTSADPEHPAKIGEYKRLALAVRLIGFRPLRSRVEPHMFGPAFRTARQHRPLLHEWSSRVHRTDRAALRKAVHAVADRPGVAAELSAITTPTLIAVGADDHATPPTHAHRLADLIPHASLHIIDDCGHTSTLEQPQRVTDLLTTFLRETPA
ncbi:alpha/beta fold hydrolase [Nocardia niigatensis]|uniref:alpha/beta fold hydrolase n=1 Tax=Nocardia niigatensis TaxID=209249 RepID=UPI0002F924EB|nr:alpha/beta fold hydrolase [Nocardia niigatensis]